MYPEYKTQCEYNVPLLADNLFCDLKPRSFASLAKIKHSKRFRKGVRFFSKGEKPCCIYLLRNGAAQLVLNDESKKTRVARLIARNELFGVLEMIANSRYETNAETITACTCECIEREDFIRFLRSEPEVCFRLVKLLGLNLQKSYERLFSSIN